MVPTVVIKEMGITLITAIVIMEGIITNEEFEIITLTPPNNAK